MARAGSPANLLLAAWHYRLAGVAVKKRGIAWGWALPLGLLNGLLLWLLSDDRRFMLRVTNPFTGQEYTLLPVVLLLAAPISAAALALFLTGAGDRRGWARGLAVGLGLAAATAYAGLTFPQILPQVYQQQYLTLMVLHLGLLSWGGAGIVALAGRRDAGSRFAFLVKSLEAVVVGGLLAAAWGIFTGVTFGLFNALGIELAFAVQRLFIAGGGGLIVLVAVALVYDPAAAPREQSFDEGPGKLVALLLRLLLPLAVVVLAVYLGFIPFNWREPFENREVLVAFNALLFAVIALLLGVTPVHEADLSARTQTWLRRGVIALAGLALVISLYALAAIIYRATADRLTPNRLTFIGWDIVNIAILAALLVGQTRAGVGAGGRAGGPRPYGLAAVQRALAGGAVLYLAWSLVALLALPWLFRGNLAEVAHLPAGVQQVAYERAAPILLKCPISPHVYLLEKGEKRWVKDIITFTAQGYTWNDVQTVRCDELRQVPDGVPIPPDAGPPPMP